MSKKKNSKTFETLQQSEIKKKVKREPADILDIPQHEEIETSNENEKDNMLVL